MMNRAEERANTELEYFRSIINKIIGSHNILFEETNDHIVFSCEKFSEIENIISDIKKRMPFVSFDAQKAKSDVHDIQKALTDMSEEIKDIKDQLRFYGRLMKQLKRYVNDTQRANSDAIVGIWNRLDKLEGKTG